MLTFLPFAFLHVSVFVRHGSVSVWVAVEPSAFVPLSFRPGKHSIPGLLVLLVLAYIFFAVRHRKRSVAMHLSLAPRSLVLLAIIVSVNSVTLEQTVLEIAFVNSTLW